jgi:hypothetical protein
MKIAAYICLGDPAWIEASVLSYYPHVTKIIATFDRSGRSWSGPEIDVDVCIRRLQAIDIDNKVEYVGGDFCIEQNFDNPIVSDTYQRNVGLTVASQYGDWVLQLDTDEIIPNWDVFISYIDFANAHSFDAVYFPSIYVYQLISRNLALESCRRWGTRQAGFPGPLSVKSGSNLYLSRRSLGSTLHVPCENGFDTVIEKAAVVTNNRVASNNCVIHITKGRTPAYMEKKFRTWGHSRDRDFSWELRYWTSVRRFPWVFLLVSHVLRGGNVDKFRLFRIPQSLKPLLCSNTLEGEFQQS